MKLNLTWTDFRSQISQGLPFRFLSISSVYFLYTVVDGLELECVIPQNGQSDQTDFDTNYKATAVNYSLSPLSPGSYRNITGNSIVTVKAGPGVLMGIWVNNNTTAGSAVIYDNVADSGTKIGTLQFGSPSGGLVSSTGQPSPNAFTALNVKFTTGLTVVTSGSTSNDITVVYR